jgi:hypothetical protein
MKWEKYAFETDVDEKLNKFFLIANCRNNYIKIILFQFIVVIVKDFLLCLFLCRDKHVEYISNFSNEI